MMQVKWSGVLKMEENCINRLYKSRIGMLLYKDRKRHSKPLYKTNVETQNIGREDQGF